MVPESPTKKYADRYSIAFFLAPNVDTVVTCLKIKKMNAEKKRFALTSRVNYDERQPVIAMEYILDKLVTSYAKTKVFSIFE